MSYLFNNKVGFEDTATDAFARLRVSTPFTLFDSQHRYKDNRKFDTAVTNGGTAEFKLYQSAVDLTIGATAGASVIRQSKRVFAYQPGKSMLVMNTVAMNPGKANLTQRVGFYNSENGIYFEQGGLLGVSLAFVLRSNVTGSTAERRVYQSEWNGDKLDGSGPTGRTLDYTKGNIFWMDVEWLGVGDVRCGFIVDGKPVIAHTFHNENLYNTTYMTTACLPIRAEIFNGSTAGSASTLKQICSTVISEGGFEPVSPLFHAGTTLAPINLAVAGQYYHVVSIRMKSDRLDSIVIPANISAAIIPQNANQPRLVRWDLISNANLIGAGWTAHSENSAVEYAYPTTPAAGITVSGGTSIRSGYFDSNATLELGGSNGAREFAYQLGHTIGGTSDTVTLAVAPYDAGVNYLGELGWFELL